MFSVEEPLFFTVLWDVTSFSLVDTSKVSKEHPASIFSIEEPLFSVIFWDVTFFSLVDTTKFRRNILLSSSASLKMLLTLYQTVRQ
jgi:hypothetical protein